MSFSLVSTGTCDLCKGVGSTPNEMAGHTFACTYCEGSGVRKVRGYGGYRTAAGAAKALASGTGQKCHGCSGTGQSAYSDTLNCYRCEDGVVVTSVHGGDFWGEVSSRLRYNHVSGSVLAEFLQSLTFHVVTEEREGTWNEAYLGLGSIVSVTDYGTAHENLANGTLTDDALISKVRDGLTSVQLVQFTRDDATLATDVMISVHRSGYTVKALGSARTGISRERY